MRRPWITNIRVVLVLILSLGVLGTLIYYSFKSFERFTVLVDQLDDQPTWQAELADLIVIDISELDNLARTYQLSLSRSDLEPYLDKVDGLQEEIDSLYIGSFGTDYHDEVDTLREVFQEKITNFESLIQFKISQSVLQDDISALQLLALSRDEIVTDSMLLPTKNVTTTTITVNNEDSLRSAGFFSRIFGGQKDKESPSREMMQERTVAYDTAYFEKVDTMMASVESALRRAESQRRFEERLLANRELQIASNDLLIIDKLKSIASTIREMNERATFRSRQQALFEAEVAVNQVLFWVICGSLLTIIFTVWVIADIFKGARLQGALEEAKQKAESLATSREEFLANMSHELRTPLNTVVGLAGQLKQGEANDISKLNSLQNSSAHVLRIVNDILDFSKIESGKLRIDQIGFKPETIVKECYEMIHYQAEVKNLDLQLDMDEGLKGLIVSGDPLRLKQILINLVSNAIKFTEKGFVRIYTKIEFRDSDNCRIHFGVEDTGKGIAASKLSEIFNSYEQEDGTIDRRYGGTGLGLAISRKLIEMQSGKWDVISEPGEGANFSFTLQYPLALREVYSGNFNPQSAAIDLSGKKLLLIDDDEMNHILLRPAFERWRLDFSSAHTGKHGLELALESSYDFILIDLNLPDIRGEEVVKQLIKNSGNQQSKLILCTANPLITKQNPELVASADALLLKPFQDYEVAALLGGETTEELNPVPPEDLSYQLNNFSKYAGDDPVILKKFIESFIKSNKENIELLDKYQYQGDKYALADVAHKMKNTYGQLEVDQIMKLLVMLEDPLIKLSSIRKKELIEEITLLSVQLFEMLKEEVKALP